MYPYHILAEIVKNDIGKSFRDELVAFANWEALRYFHDDPQRKSKDALQWIQDMDRLVKVIEEEYQGPGKESCMNAMEAAFVAFSRLDLPEELCTAIRKWRAYRFREELAGDEPITIGEET